MIPVMQNRFSSHEDPNQHGNCFDACVASILELPLEEVPAFTQMGREWFPPFFQFLRRKGYDYIGIGKPEEMGDYKEGVKGCYIVSGSSPRGFAKGHAVVYKDGALAHDPHPEGTGVGEVWHFWMIEPLKKD